VVLVLLQKTQSQSLFVSSVVRLSVKTKNYNRIAQNSSTIFART
jgi:hypothetical protein